MALNLKEYIYDKYLSKIRFCFVLCINWLVIDLCWFGILYWFIINFGFWRVFHGFVVNFTWLGNIFFCLSLWSRFDFVVWLGCVFFCLSFRSWFVVYLAWFGSVLFFSGLGSWSVGFHWFVRWRLGLVGRYVRLGCSLISNSGLVTFYIKRNN